jgi:dTDP-4-dehydrorhamnose 3,5-epimerase
VTDFAERSTAIEGLVVLTMKQVGDDRGTVRELFRASAHGGSAAGLLGPIAQINVTETRCGAVRGFHAEATHKLVSVVAGEAHGAYVDLRHGSPSWGTVVSVALVPGVQVFVPSGVGNAFQALTDGAQYAYCFAREWEPGMPGTASNPLQYAWPIPIDPADRSQISQKDADLPTHDHVNWTPELGGSASAASVPKNAGVGRRSASEADRRAGLRGRGTQ